MKTKYVGFLSCFWLLSLVGSAMAETINIWQNCGNKKQEKISVKVDVYRSEQSVNNAPAVIVCPGGSYYYFAIKRETIEVAKLLTEQGFTAFVLKYRTAVRGYHHPAMIQDLQRTIQIVKENAGKYGVDSAKVGLMGFSAGGHLAGIAATYWEQNFMETLNIIPKVSLKPYFTVMVYPVVTMRKPFCHKKSKYCLLGYQPTEKMIQQLSLEENVHKNIPPLLLLQAKDDRVVDYRNSVLYDQALKKENSNHKFILYQSGGHGFGGIPDQTTDMRTWFRDFINWFKS